MPVLRYVLDALKKEGESHFTSSKELKIEDVEGLNFPVTKIEVVNSSSPPLKGFMYPSQGLHAILGSLPIKRQEGFDPNAYKLLASLGMVKT